MVCALVTFIITLLTDGNERNITDLFCYLPLFIVILSFCWVKLIIWQGMYIFLMKARRKWQIILGSILYFTPLFMVVCIFENTTFNPYFPPLCTQILSLPLPTYIQLNVARIPSIILFIFGRLALQHKNEIVILESILINTTLVIDLIG